MRGASPMMRRSMIRRRRMRRMMFFGFGMGMFWGVPGFRRRQRAMNAGCSILGLGVFTLIIGISLWAGQINPAGIVATIIGGIVLLLGIFISVSMSRSLGRMRRQNEHLWTQDVFDEHGNPAGANASMGGTQAQPQTQRLANCPNCGAANEGSSVCVYCSTAY